jgi:hypothetical protein
MRLVRYGGAMSLDGYIATPTGGYDWTTQDPDMDFAAMMARFDSFLIGRKTFDTMGRSLTMMPPNATTIVILSVPGHALRCGPETSVTSPLRSRWFELRGYEKTYIQLSMPWKCGNPEGISKECGKGGKPASWLSMLSTLCHFHGLLTG